MAFPALGWGISPVPGQVPGGLQAGAGDLCNNFPLACACAVTPAHEILLVLPYSQTDLKVLH